MTKKFLLPMIIAASSMPLSLYAAENSTELNRELAQLKSQIQNLEMRMASAGQSAGSSAAGSAADVTAPIHKSRKKTHHRHKKITKINDNGGASAFYVSGAAPGTLTSPANLIPHLSWQGPDIAAVMVGGASAGYSKPSGNNGSFNILDFNPIFLFGYKDIIFLRSSVDFSLDDYANTDVSLNYTNLNLFLGDYAVFGVGSFDSALGYFGQNLSPAWINRMPDAPVGFNADQAAPQTEVGMRLQGAFPLFCTMKINYALFIADGDQAFVDTTNLVIDHIGTDGYTNNFGHYMYGGRIGFLPIPKLEIGASFATGKLVLINLADGVTVLQPNRVYHAAGADISYKPGDWDLRAEYIQQMVSSQSGSIVPQGQKWKAWYGQVAYWIPGTKWEPVVRYSKFTAPVANQEQSQWAFGLDYWFAPSIVAQASFELNKGQSGSSTNDNLFQIQLAFGF